MGKQTLLQQIVVLANITGDHSVLDPVPVLGEPAFQELTV